MTDPALLARVLRVVAPPQREVTHASVASALLLPDGPRQGKPYRWNDDPIHRHVIKELDAHRWDSFALVGAVQTGKSLVSVLVPALRQLIFQRRAVVYAQPSQQKLHEAWTGKVSPAIDGAGLGGWLPTDGQGARGGQTPKFVVMRDPETKARAGMLYLIHGGGRNEGAQASVSAPTVLIDEVDSFQSAHRIALIGKRADSFGRQAVRVYTSTVKADGEPGAEDGSIILGLYQDSTKSRLWFPCPDCRTWQPLEWERVSYDATDEGTAADTVRIACVSCGVMHDEAGRQRMLTESRIVHGCQTINAAGETVGSEPRTRRLGLLWTALDSSLRDLPTLAIEHWRATQSLARGDHGPLRSFVRDQLCRPYKMDEDSDRPELVESVLLNISSQASYNRGEVPTDAEAVTITVDVQLRRHYWLAVAYDSDGAWWVIDWGRDAICGDMANPTPEDRAEGLERLDGIHRGGFQKQGGGMLTTSLGGIDTGFRPDEIRPWIRPRRSRWIATKGAGAELARRMVSAPVGSSIKREEGWYDLREQDDAPDRRQLFVDADPALERIAADWRSGRGHLPRDVDHELLRHLTGMQRDGAKWKPRGARHDFLDCLVYALAIAKFSGGRPTSTPQTRRKYGAIGAI